MGDISEFDDALFSILKDCGNLPNFFNVVFGFLSRRTDFYVTKEPNNPVGMPDGYAEMFVKNAFYKWKRNNSANTESVSKIADLDEEITDSGELEIHSEIEISSNDIVQKSRDSQEIERDKSSNIFSASDCYNGATFNNYSWSQTISELGIIIKVPENVTSKMLDINVTAQSISVMLKNDEDALLQGEFRHKCKHLDIIWSLVGTKLDIQLEKVSEIWWDCLLLTEPRIDVQKIDCSRPFEDLSDSAQAKIEELQWNQERKRLGLPTSEELAKDKLCGRILGSHDAKLKDQS